MLHSEASRERSAAVSHPRWLRRCALVSGLSFLWTFVLAGPVAALTHQSPVRPMGVRPLSSTEMQRLVGQQIGNFHQQSVSRSAGSTFPWEGSVGGVNTGNGNKLTAIPLVSWTQRGGLPLALTLSHNSEGNHDSELGQKWTFSFDLYLAATTNRNGSNNETIHWGNDLSYTFTNNGSNVFSPPTGIHDSFVQNVDNTFTLTTPDQTVCHFTTGGYCDTITDENGNQISIAHNSGNYVTSVTDATSRSLTFTYDSSNRIHTITDPLSRQWTLNYDSSNQLQTINLPLINSTTYSWTFGYDTNHNITSIQSPAATRGRPTTTPTAVSTGSRMRRAIATPSPTPPQPPRSPTPTVMS